jgi:hypothetical protein
MFLGGQAIPSSMEGARLEWKKAQKKETKKRISEVINRIIPRRILASTSRGWWPWRVASREMSRHHWVDEINRPMRPMNMRTGEFPLNQ